MNSYDSLWSFGQYTFTTIVLSRSFSITTAAILPSSSVWLSSISYELSNSVITPPLFVLMQLEWNFIFQYILIMFSSIICVSCNITIPPFCTSFLSLVNILLIFMLFPSPLQLNVLSVKFGFISSFFGPGLDSMFC